MNPPELKYSKDHEWARVEGDRAVVGITQFATEQLGDVVYVDLARKAGDEVRQFEAFGTVESVKAASDLFSPLGGKITKTNDALADRPELVNQDPYGDGWMIELALSDPAELNSLMSAEEYEATTKES